MKNAWDERYSNKEYIYGTEPNDFLKDHIAELPMGHVLSVAEGEGRNAVFLAEKGYRVTAVDSSRVGLDKAEKLAKSRNVTIETVCADLAQYQLEENSYDAIVSIFCHMPPDARKALYQQLSSALKPGGVLLLEAYTPAQVGRGTGGPPEVPFTVSLEEMRGYLSDFDIVHGEELERHVVEGTFHTGEGAVVQIIAKRK